MRLRPRAKKYIYYEKKIVTTALFLSAAFVCTASVKNIKSTYYGTKASTNANNPCKGATTRVCGEIDSGVVELSDDGDFVTLRIDNIIKQIDGTTWIKTEELTYPKEKVRNNYKIVIKELEEKRIIEAMTKE